uniref:DUF4843 domain-containing protein n=1 Tax=Pedobacter schmidteae TaxID=2201271 RepID=UPI000EAFE2B1|nr:DUF4843 domain-containing protein [Pedobacter schmidteae]
MYPLKYFMVLACAAALFTSCKNDNYLLYETESRIQFGPERSKIYQSSYNLADTLKPYSFAYTDAVQDTVFFDIYAIGKVSAKDRAVKLEQVQVSGQENAIPGTHYQDFSNPSVAGRYIIKAEESHTRVPVVLLRDASLKTKTVMLKISVANNEAFRVGEPAYAWRKIELTDRLSRPAAWTDFMTSTYFGKYSVTKHRFMIEQTGERWDQDFMKEILQRGSTSLIYWQGVLKTAVTNYNNAHPGSPLKDEFNELVIIP